MEIKKDISYLGKDFAQFKQNLINFTKQYFPNDYTDFSEASPGTIFLEMAAYVGDVLSYYADTNLKESFIQQATERSNVYELSKALGYNVKNSVPGFVTLDVFQLVPAIGTGADVRPDYTYALNIKPGMRVKQNNGNAQFRTLDVVDFAASGSNNPTDVTVYESDDITNLPTYYLLKKQVRAVSGEVKTSTYSFGNPIPYDKVVFPETNVIDIISVEESDGDNWYQVPYLGQDTIFEEIENIAENDPLLSQYRGNVPKLLKLRKTAKRYVTRLRSDNKTELQFGAGISDNNDEEIIPNADNVGNGLAGFRRPIDVDIDPSNFLYTRAYGQAPADTTLTVTYTIGNGISDNVSANTLTLVDFVEYQDNVNATGVSTSVLNFAKRTLSVNNATPAQGAKSQESIIEVKTNALTNFATQNRSVTIEDYVVRCYSLPAKFGSIAKAYIVADDQLTQQQVVEENSPNPFALNLYVLGFNNNKQLVNANQAIKENLKTYLDYYRILTDAINIKDAFVINVGLDFEITVLPNYNSNSVLLDCIANLKDYFNIDRWQINQPIIKSEVVNTIGNTKGVQNVVSVTMNNKFDTELGYSGNQYDLTASTRNGIVYPSLDPSIFEIKFPDSDIKGRVVNY
jgi:hypothetical protein